MNSLPLRRGQEQPQSVPQTSPLSHHKQEAWLLHWPAYSWAQWNRHVRFFLTAVTNDHKLTGLTQNTFVIPWACRRLTVGCRQALLRKGPGGPVFPPLCSQAHPLSIYKASNSPSTVHVHWSSSPPTLASCLRLIDSWEDPGPSLAPELSTIGRASLPC